MFNNAVGQKLLLSCPFSFLAYQHAYPDGRLEEVKLRHLSSGDGNTVIAREIR